MWPDRVSNSGSLTYESGALSTAIRGRLSAREAKNKLQKLYPFVTSERLSMVCAPVRRDNHQALARELSTVQAHKPCYISLVPCPV